MPNLLVWYVGNTSPSITENIEVEGVPFDLSASTVRFKMRLVGSSDLKVDQPATIVGPPINGDVRYDWAAGDVDTESPALIWWEVTTAGKKQDMKEYLIEFRQHSPLANSYLELEEAKKTLTLEGTSFADLDLESAIAAASRAVDDICERRFFTTPADEIRYYTPERYRGRCDSLKIDDLTALTEVAVDLDDNGTYEQVWAENVDFRLEPYNAPLESKPWNRITLTSSAGRYFPTYAHSVRVTGRFGWTPAPAAVKLATHLLTSRWLKRMREAPFGVVGIGPDGEAVRMLATDPDVLAILSPYRRTALFV